MSRWKMILVLLICLAVSQTLTIYRPSHLPVFLHAPCTFLRPLLMAGAAGFLATLLFKYTEYLPPSEALSLLAVLAGDLANLMDLLRLGAVVDFIPVAPRALASPGDFLAVGGILIWIPISLHHAQEGRGAYASYYPLQKGAQNVRLLWQKRWRDRSILVRSIQK